MAEYIEREQVYESLYANADGEQSFDMASARVGAYERIEAIPSADVQPVVYGHWTWEEGVFVYGIDRDALGSYRCTACGNCSPHITNYCPICGARMEVDDG